MANASTSVSVAREPRLLGQTVVVIGGSAGIGLETARRARSEGADIVVTARDPRRLEQAARELSARSSAAFDADDAAAVKRFFDELPAPIDHVLVAAYTRRSHGPMLESPSEEVGQSVGRRVSQVLEIARHAAPKMRAGGTLLLTGGSERTFSREYGITPAAFSVLPPFTAALALELAPVARQPHPSRLRGHRAGDVVIRRQRSGRGQTRRAACHTADPAGRRTGRHRGARRAPHDQHRHHRGGLRHRRGPAARRLTQRVRASARARPMPRRA